MLQLLPVVTSRATKVKFAWVSAEFGVEPGMVCSKRPSNDDYLRCLLLGGGGGFSNRGKGLTKSDISNH